MRTRRKRRKKNRPVERRQLVWVVLYGEDGDGMVDDGQDYGWDGRDVPQPRIVGALSWLINRLYICNSLQDVVADERTLCIVLVVFASSPT
jgi:hypothetical protein